MFAGLGEDVLIGMSSDPDDISSARPGRRRAYTDINDLLDNDMRNGEEDPNNRVNKEPLEGASANALETQSENKREMRNEFKLDTNLDNVGADRNQLTMLQKISNSLSALH